VKLKEKVENDTRMVLSVHKLVCLTQPG